MNFRLFCKCNFKNCRQTFYYFLCFSFNFFFSSFRLTAQLKNVLLRSSNSTFLALKRLKTKLVKELKIIHERFNSSMLTQQVTPNDWETFNDRLKLVSPFSSPSLLLTILSILNRREFLISQVLEEKKLRSEDFNAWTESYKSLHKFKFFLEWS